MRQIKDLEGQAKKVWIFLETGEQRREFLARAAEEGSRWMNGDPIKASDRAVVVGLGPERTLGQVGLFLWCQSFQCHPDILRVHYGRYRAGEEDYLCRRPGLAGGLKLG